MADTTLMNNAVGPAETDFGSVGNSNECSANALFGDIQEMMFGFGDSMPSDPASVALMDSLVREYITALCQGCCKIADLTNKLDKESLLFLIRKDKHRYDRVCRLLKANEVVKRSTRITFDDKIDDDDDDDDNNVDEDDGEEE